MRISDILTICFRNLIRRKLRTFLTALGVVIGVALIIVAVSIGIGLSITYDEQMASWGGPDRYQRLQLEQPGDHG